jgi:hypothetical protein
MVSKTSAGAGDGTVEINIEDRRDRWRYVCPNGHRDWSRTNSHIWCATCARRPDGEPEHYEIVDRKHNVTIPWKDVSVVEHS